MRRFELDAMTEAYDTFADAAGANSLKIVLSGHPVNLPKGEKTHVATG